MLILTLKTSVLLCATWLHPALWRLRPFSLGHLIPRLNRTSCCWRRGSNPFPSLSCHLHALFGISPQRVSFRLRALLRYYQSQTSTSKPHQHKLVPTVLYDTVSLGLRRLQLAPVLAHLCRGRFRWRHLGTEGVVAEPFRASPVTVYILW